MKKKHEELKKRMLLFFKLKKKLGDNYFKGNKREKLSSNNYLEILK